MNITIDLMKEEELSEVMEIENKSFSAPWSLKTFLYELKDNPYSLYLTAHQGSNIIGYAGGWSIGDRFHITNLAVDENYRKKGVATALTEEIIKRARKKGISILTLEVRVSNRPAINLYKKMGFYKKEFFSGYYTNNNEDALLMRKELANEQRYDKDSGYRNFL